MQRFDVISIIIEFFLLPYRNDFELKKRLKKCFLRNWTLVLAWRTAEHQPTNQSTNRRIVFSFVVAKKMMIFFCRNTKVTPFFIRLCTNYFVDIETSLSLSKLLSLYLCRWCFKTFFRGNLDFPKIKKLETVCSDAWTCTKCKNNAAIFKQKYTHKLLKAFKWSFLLLQHWGKSRFSRIPPKFFYNINYKSCVFF